MTYLEFEKPLADIRQGRGTARAGAQGRRRRSGKRGRRAGQKAAEMLRDLYKQLPRRKTLVARHPERPHCKDYIEQLFTEYTPLAGDRAWRGSR